MDVPIKVDNSQIEFSEQKLQIVAKSLADWVPKDLCRQIPCESIEQSVKYRCRCSFQCIWIENKVHYAVRRRQEPIIIDTFPSANRRIQTAMTILQTTLNCGCDRFSILRQNLTSVTFSSAWRDSDDADCLLSLFYDKLIQDAAIWKQEALLMCRLLNMAQITGRSRKRVLLAIDNRDSMIRDVIWLVHHNNKWRVSLLYPSLQRNIDIPGLTRSVHYEKPEGAFCHPNATAMRQALEWLIQRLDCIQQKSDVSKRKKNRLLELYCGCGAHTMALLQTNILETIVAIELDQRLVHACQRNYELNQAARSNDDKLTTSLNILSADAGMWSKKWITNPTAVSSLCNSFDILLVDPPRQGLDENVCRFASNSTFQHFFYISCGHDALVRDLSRLSDNFEVVDCTLLDLFPQTDAVESLVHLRRRSG
jgi:tRNA (uracil-5-)-methyltransferase